MYHVDIYALYIKTVTVADAEWIMTMLLLFYKTIYNEFKMLVDIN